MTEQGLIDAARAGDEQAFAALVEPRRGELRAHCYRMLGSATDAEDALQDALLGAWRGLRAFEGRSSLRSWLYRIATNACLRAIDRRPPRVLPIDIVAVSHPDDPLAERQTEIPWLQPIADDLLGLEASPAGPEARYALRESVELAFVAALQHLPARQRAVLVLRDVLGYSAAEVAGLLDTTPASVNSALQRAHATVDDRLPEQSQQVTLRALGDAAITELVTAYTDAWERNDVDALAALLTDDVRLTMPPIPMWFAGRENVARFIARFPLSPTARPHLAVPIRLNGQAAVLGYMRHDRDAPFTVASLAVFDVRDDRIARWTAFLDDRDVRRVAASLRKPETIHRSAVGGGATSP